MACKGADQYGQADLFEYFPKTPFLLVCFNMDINQDAFSSKLLTVVNSLVSQASNLIWNQQHESDFIVLQWQDSSLRLHKFLVLTQPEKASIILCLCMSDQALRL